MVMKEVQPEVTIRFAGEADGERLRKLSELDSARVPAGPVLIAEVNGRFWAALALDRQEVVADPFRRTADIIALLRVRAAQLSERPRRRRGPVATTLSALERRTAHLRSSKPLAPL